MARGITADELALLDHVSRWGSDGYPVRKLGARRWTWGPWRTIAGPPTVYTRKRDAIESVEKYLDILRDAKAGRI
ncbi:MAG: hypothetical protein IVW54_16755 [Candidatus Binataceae bacterium]|nr:hypothetical protein [Candidatus Binataceae bacterium]